MLHKVLGMAFLLVTTATVARADIFQDRIRSCERADAVCVGLVLLDAVRSPSQPATARTTNGYLEVLHNDEWRGVCDDGFDDLDGAVACREMGLQYVSWSTVSGTANFWLDDLACSGNESSLATCGNAGWGVHNCSAGENVSVICR